MKRFLCLVALAPLFVFGLLFAFQTNGGRTHAEANSNPDRPRKVSRDLVEKVNNGHGNELVRVIIQPTAAWEATLEETVEES
ncbi:MAG TPA: hypothetical protein VFP47_04615, partial [Pyrinomonadaceae bacterium]|nr:hypothetical protein [Pyrinomonadaceae bacterium]